MNPERRKFIRAEARAPTSIRFPETGTIKPALTKNVSGGGVRLLTEEILDRGTKVEVEVRLPDRALSVEFQGLIVWSKSTGTEIETGVQFVSIDPSDRLVMKEYAQLHAASPEIEPK